MNIPSRRKPWTGPTTSWMWADRLEHYLRLHSVDLDRAAFLAVGLIPEKFEPPWTVMWFDGPFLSRDKQGWEGDDADAIWGWMDDAKAQWTAAGGERSGIDLRAFLGWIEATYGRPGWLAIAEAEGMLNLSTVPLATVFHRSAHEAVPLAPPFPEVQGDWYECIRPPAAARLREAIQVALGLVPASNPLRWINNHLVTEPHADHSTSAALKSWTDLLQRSWQQTNSATGEIDVQEFVDWVARTFGRPKWLAGAEQCGAWPPKRLNTLPSPSEDPERPRGHWSLCEFGPENSPEIVAQRLDYWLRYDTWTRTQAIFILLGIDPDIEATSFNERNVFRPEPSFSRLTFLNGIRLVTFTWGFLEEGFSVTKNETTVRVAAADLGPFLGGLARRIEEMNAVFVSGNHPERSEFGYYLRWAAAKGFAVNPVVERHLLGLKSRTAPAFSTQAAPLSRFNAQEDAILASIKRLGKDPRALPPFRPGVKKWIKAEVWDSLKTEAKLFVSRKVFDKSWERLRQAGEIATTDLLPQIGGEGES